MEYDFRQQVDVSHLGINCLSDQKTTAKHYFSMSQLGPSRCCTKMQKRQVKYKMLILSTIYECACYSYVNVVFLQFMPSILTISCDPDFQSQKLCQKPILHPQKHISRHPASVLCKFGVKSDTQFSKWRLASILDFCAKTQKLRMASPCFGFSKL